METTETTDTMETMEGRNEAKTTAGFAGEEVWEALCRKETFETEQLFQ
jgi:hypothetical protein